MQPLTALSRGSRCSVGRTMTFRCLIGGRCGGCRPRGVAPRWSWSSRRVRSAVRRVWRAAGRVGAGTVAFTFTFTFADGDLALGGVAVVSGGPVTAACPAAWPRTVTASRCTSSRAERAESLDDAIAARARPVAPPVTTRCCVSATSSTRATSRPGVQRTSEICATHFGN